MRNLFLFLLLACFSFANAQTKRELEVNFATDSYTLNAEETNKLNAFIQSLTKSPNQYIVAVAGHTDNVGDLAYNAVLSDNRANAVAAIFKSKGFPDSKVLTSSRGEVHPIASNDNDAGKAKNRRVKIIVTEDISKKTNAISGIEIKETFYKIDAQKRETVTYKSGTKITIPENAFVDKTGNPVNGKVDLSYIEYRDPIDFILSDIPMDHDGGHFNSGGMYKILAYQNGKPVYLKKGKNIDIDFALTDNLPNMNFYRLDTINNKWSELSKLTGNVVTSKTGATTITTITVMPSMNMILYDKKSACYGDSCLQLYNTIKMGKEMASSSNSAYDDYLADRKIRDSIVATMKTRWLIEQKKADSSFAATNKKRAQEIAATIAGHEQLIASQRQELESIPSKIEKTKPYFVLTKTAEKKDGTSFKIDLKAIYNIETVNFSHTNWTSNTVVNQEAFEKEWDTCIIKKATAAYSITLKKDGKTLVIDGLKFSNNKMTNERSLISSMNNARALQIKKIDKLKKQKISLKRSIENELAKIAQLKNEKSSGRNNRDSISTRYDEPMKCFWENNKPYMNPEELALSVDDWFNYFDAHKNEMKIRYDNIVPDEACRERIALAQKTQNATENASALIKSLNIANLGIYNCDQVSRMKQPVYVNVTYKSENGTAIEPLFIYILDSNINGIIKYNQVHNFAYNATSNNALMAFDGKDAYIISAGDFINSVKSGF